MGRKPSNKPTSLDIALRAGVSQPTVSRALRGSKAVSLATRLKIEAIARELDYSIAKYTPPTRSKTLILMLEDQMTDEMDINPFFLAMLGSITRHCALRGLDLLVSLQSLDENGFGRSQRSQNAEGLILLGFADYPRYEPQLKHLVQTGTHFVRWGSVEKDAVGVTIGSDNYNAGRNVGEYLLAKGCERIAFLGHTDDHYPEFRQRYLGLKQAIENAGLASNPSLVFDAASSEAAGYHAATTLLAWGVGFDAIFAASDLIAIGAMRALADAGVSVPEDVAVIGFDDVPEANLATPTLTTVIQDIRLAGEALVDCVIKQMEGRLAVSRVLPTRLVSRASTER
jgi:DNA-binding LacI/PurR family transcriptional regulator